MLVDVCLNVCAFTSTVMWDNDDCQCVLTGRRQAGNEKETTCVQRVPVNTTSLRSGHWLCVRVENKEECQ